MTAAEAKRGVEERKTLDGYSMVRSAETAMAAAAETAKAMVQARFLVALNRQRNIDEVRQKLVMTCQRRRFAEAARYKKPVAGSYVEGPSIHFADEAVKLLGNIETFQETVFEDDDQRIVKVTVTDLESNLTKSDTVCVKKVVERKTPKAGQDIVGKRENSKGETVYLVKATDDEVFTKEGNLCAKRRRNLELQLIPRDIIEECMDEVKDTLRRQDDEDPDRARKRLLDGFAALGVKPTDLEKYLGHKTDALSPAERDDLRALGAALKDNQTTWREIMEAKFGTDSAPDRTNVNLDDFKAGDDASHTPVDAPLSGGGRKKAKPEVVIPDDAFLDALADLSRIYEEHGHKIDELLKLNKVDKLLIDIKADEPDEKIRKIVVRIAEGF